MYSLHFLEIASLFLILAWNQLIVAYHVELAVVFRDTMPLCTTAPNIEVDIGVDKKSERSELVLCLDTLSLHNIIILPYNII